MENNYKDPDLRSHEEIMQEIVEDERNYDYFNDERV